MNEPTTDHIPGTLRPCGGITPQHYGPLTKLVNLSYQADGIERVFIPEQVANFYEHWPGFDPEQDVMMVEAEGMLVASIDLIYAQEEDGAMVYRHDGVVHPEWRHTAVYEMLLDFAERRIRQIDRKYASIPERWVRCAVSEAQQTYRALLERRGYRLIRHFFRMVRPDLENIPGAPLPAGLEIRAVPPDHLRVIWEAKEEAFRDHWGHRAQTEQDFERFLNDPLHDTSLWKVAWDGDQVAGMVLNFIDQAENERYGRQRGYTEDIAVRRPWRRRGLATALIAESLRALRARGMGEAGLSVDAQNLSGALRLYERLGYQIAQVTQAYAKPAADLSHDP